MVGESWDVFTKRVLVTANHINGNMCENPGGHGPFPCPPLSTPCQKLLHDLKINYFTFFERFTDYTNMQYTLASRAEPWTLQHSKQTPVLEKQYSFH